MGHQSHFIGEEAEARERPSYFPKVTTRRGRGQTQVPWSRSCALSSLVARSLRSSPSESGL